MAPFIWWTWSCGSRASDRGSRGSGFTGNDLVMALLRFDSGLVAKVGANFASVHPHYHHVAVYGTDATFENTPSGDARLWTSRDLQQPPEPVTAPYPGVGKGDLIPAFVDAVLGHGASLQQFRGIVWEYAAILFYRSRGWL